MDDSLRIGILHYSCPPVVGGVEEMLHEQARVLSRMGQSVSVLVGMGGESSAGYEVRIEPVLKSNHGAPQIYDSLKEGAGEELDRSTNEVYDLLLDWSRNLDVILAHNVLQMPFNLPLTLALRKLAESKARPVVVSWAHDSPYFHQSVPERLQSPPWEVLRQPHPDIHYVTISEARKRFFKRVMNEADWKVVSDGIDPVKFLFINPDSINLVEPLDLFSRDLIFVQPARITPRKYIELSIHIVSAVKERGFNVLLLLTGALDPFDQKAPAYSRRLKYWIKELDLEDNIAILADLTLEDGTALDIDRTLIRDLYTISDLLLMTSTDEGFGLTLLEAGMVKLPIACSNIPAFLEVAKDVCFFELDEPPAIIAERIIQYLTHLATDKMFRNVLSNYVLDNICKKTLLPYLRVLTGR